MPTLEPPVTDSMALFERRHHLAASHLRAQRRGVLAFMFRVTASDGLDSANRASKSSRLFPESRSMASSSVAALKSVLTEWLDSHSTNK